MNFNELNLSVEVTRALEDMGFEKATPIQAEAIPPVLEGLDIIGQAQTGTGKTAAFGIPLLEKIDPKIKNPQALILCPTRELAVQVANEFRKLGKYKTNVKCMAIYGGEPIRFQIMGLRKGCQIIVGTPGRVIDHINRKTIKLNHVNTMILDEADEMLKMGFREDIESILGSVENEQRQMLLFSATMPKPILDITHKFQNNPKLIKVVSKELTTKNVTQQAFNVRSALKVEALTRLLGVHKPKLSLVFCNTKRTVDEVTDQLLQKGYACDKIHGDIDQKIRLDVLSKFNRGLINILVATDVAARGIDINDVEAVFNFDVPEKEDYYVHRIGRTGRAGRSGASYTLVGEREGYRLRNIMGYTKCKIERCEVPTIKKVNKSKIQQFKENLKVKMDSTEDLEKYMDIILALENDGYMPSQIAAALLASNLEISEQDEVDFAPVRRRRDDRDRHQGRRNDRGGDRRRGDRRDGERRDRRLRGNVSRLHINLGKKHGIREKDIVGAIAGEAGIRGREIGSIEMYDKFTFVEIPDQHAGHVIEVMNKSRIRGKKIRVENAKAK